MKLDNARSASIAGGASGLGEAAARRRAARGVNVALFGLNQGKGEALAKEVGNVFCFVHVNQNQMSTQVSPSTGFQDGMPRSLKNASRLTDIECHRHSHWGASKNFCESGMMCAPQT
jgi:hypothetical protein